MQRTRRCSFTLDHVTFDQISEVQAQMREHMGVRLSMARIVCAAVEQYRDRIMKATEAVNHAEG